MFAVLLCGGVWVRNIIIIIVSCRHFIAIMHEPQWGEQLEMGREGGRVVVSDC